ncbi:MAG: GTPase RsgA [Chloroflexi bacterium]|nr:MAG: GTPase RsgA [Chloroflexota bacterium]
MRAQPPSTRCGGRTDLGWGHDLEGAFAAHRAHGLRPARVAIEHRGAYTILEPGPGGPCEGLAAVSGRFRYGTTRPADYPAVGDWVAIDGDTSANSATIHAVLPRRTAFSRLAAGLRTEAQVVAANVDVVFVAMGLDGDFNLRRLERYLAVAWGSGARPVVLLTKADACPDVEGMRIAASATAPGVEVLAVSAVSGQGLGVVAARVGLGTTAAVLGSSGVGKSTLINALLGRSVLATAAVRDDDRGRHSSCFPLAG